MLFCLILSISLLVKCETPRLKSVLLKENSPYQILQDTIITSDIVIEPGVVIELADSVSITFQGNVTALGKQNNGIVFKPINSSWEYLNFEGENNKHQFEHVTFINGKLLFKSNSTVEIVNVNFNNTAIQDQKNGLLVMSGGGTFYGDSINMKSNNTGEGIVVCGLHKMVIKNSIFNDVNDAVELMISKNGFIQGCYFNQCAHDDGIDLDGCENVIIRDNTFEGIADNCIEVGWDNLSHAFTMDVIINNNSFSNSKVGIRSKEYSEVIFDNNSFFNCEKEIEISDTAYVVF